MSQSQLWLVGEFGLCSTCFALFRPLRLTRQSGRCSFNHRLPVQLRLFLAECIGMSQKPEMQGGSERKMKQNSQLNLESLNYMNIDFIHGTSWKIKKGPSTSIKMVHQWPCQTPTFVSRLQGSEFSWGPPWILETKNWTARGVKKKHATFSYQN